MQTIQGERNRIHRINFLDLGDLVTALAYAIDLAKSTSGETGKYFAHSMDVKNGDGKELTLLDLYETTLSDGSKVYGVELS